MRALYDELRYTRGPSRQARLRAQRDGVLSTLDYDDIDTDTLAERRPQWTRADEHVDDDRVRDVLDRRRHPDELTTEERRAAVGLLTADGWTVPGIARRLGTDRTTVVADRSLTSQRHRNRARKARAA